MNLLHDTLCQDNPLSNTSSKYSSSGLFSYTVVFNRQLLELYLLFQIQPAVFCDYFLGLYTKFSIVNSLRLFELFSFEYQLKFRGKFSLFCYDGRGSEIAPPTIS